MEVNLRVQVNVRIWGNIAYESKGRKAVVVLFALKWKIEKAGPFNPISNDEVQLLALLMSILVHTCVYI